MENKRRGLFGGLRKRLADIATAIRTLGAFTESEGYKTFKEGVAKDETEAQQAKEAGQEEFAEYKATKKTLKQYALVNERREESAKQLAKDMAAYIDSSDNPFASQDRPTESLLTMEKDLETPPQTEEIQQPEPPIDLNKFQQETLAKLDAADAAREEKERQERRERLQRAADTEELKQAVGEDFALFVDDMRVVQETEHQTKALAEFTEELHNLDHAGLTEKAAELENRITIIDNELSGSTDEYTNQLLETDRLTLAEQRDAVRAEIEKRGDESIAEEATDKPVDDKDIIFEMDAAAETADVPRPDEMEDCSDDIIEMSEEEEKQSLNPAKVPQRLKNTSPAPIIERKFDFSDVEADRKQEEPEDLQTALRLNNPFYKRGEAKQPDKPAAFTDFAIQDKLAARQAQTKRDKLKAQLAAAARKKTVVEKRVAPPPLPPEMRPTL